MYMKYTEELREKVVRDVMSCELFIEEAMEKYNVASRSTIIRWLKAHLDVADAESDLAGKL